MISLTHCGPVAILWCIPVIPNQTTVLSNNNSLSLGDRSSPSSAPAPPPSFPILIVSRLFLKTSTGSKHVCVLPSKYTEWRLLPLWIDCVPEAFCGECGGAWGLDRPPRIWRFKRPPDMDAKNSSQLGSAGWSVCGHKSTSSEFQNDTVWFVVERTQGFSEWCAALNVKTGCVWQLLCWGLALFSLVEGKKKKIPTGSIFNLQPCWMRLCVFKRFLFLGWDSFSGCAGGFEHNEPNVGLSNQTAF